MIKSIIVILQDVVQGYLLNNLMLYKCAIKDMIIRSMSYSKRIALLNRPSATKCSHHLSSSGSIRNITYFYMSDLNVIKNNNVCFVDWPIFLLFRQNVTLYKSRN